MLYEVITHGHVGELRAGSAALLRPEGADDGEGLGNSMEKHHVVLGSYTRSEIFHPAETGDARPRVGSSVLSTPVVVARRLDAIRLGLHGADCPPFEGGGGRLRA